MIVYGNMTEIVVVQLVFLCCQISPYNGKCANYVKIKGCEAY